MMRKVDFDPLLQAVEQLNWQEEAGEIREMQRTTEENNFFVAFVGCYSAGKSCLINNLLGRELLPHGTTETTTILTYIRYAEEEKAVLHRTDGSAQDIPLEEVSGVDQRRETWNTEELDYLEVFLNSELLQSGMILMDTPGINTVIQRHEQLLKKTLAVAARVVYVMGGPPSRVDLDLLDEMRRRGLKPACVRTHFDRVNRREEDAEQVMHTDRTRLAEHGVEQESCYFISNLKESGYYENIVPLQAMLAECGSHAQEQLQESVRARLCVLAGRCEKELEQQLEALKQLEQQNQAAVQKKCEELRAQIDALEQSVGSREEEIQNKLDQARRKLDGAVARKMESDLEDSADRIADSSADRNDTIALIRAEAKKQLESLNWQISEIGTDVLQQTNEELTNTLQTLSLEMTPELTTDDFTELQKQQDDETEELRQTLVRLKQNRQQLEQELEGMDLDRIKQELDDAEQRMRAARSNLDGQEMYIPELVAKRPDGMQPSEIAADIGKLADLALFLLPGDVLVDGAKAVAGSGAMKKVISGTLKGKDSLGKLMRNAGRMAKGVDDKRDMLYLIRGLQESVVQKKRTKQIAQEAEVIASATGKVLTTGAKGVKGLQDYKELQGYSEEDKPNFLDLATVEYWARKFGRLFDKPPQWEENQEKAALWNAERTHLENELRDKQMKAYEMRREYHAFASYEEELKAKKEAMIVQEDELQREWEKRKSQLEAEAKREKLEQWHRDCADWYLEKVRPELQAVLAQARNDLPERILTYQRKQLDDVRQRLQAKKKEYDALLNAPAAENRKKLDDTAGLLNRLKEQYGSI